MVAREPVDIMDYRGRKVLVTGADGFIGSHLVESLVLQGADVTALTLYNSFDSLGWLDELSPATRQAIHCVRGDVRDGGQMDRLISGQDTIFHLAALIAIPFSYAAPRAFIDTNVIGTLNILEAARAHRVRRVVHTSTSEVYGTACYTPINESHPLQGQSPYSASKIAADMLVESFARSFETPVVILRPFNTYGPRQSERAVISTVIRQALDPACPGIEVGDLSPRRDFTFVTDTVAAFLSLGMSEEIKKGTAYNAGSGEAITIGELVQLVQELVGSRKPVVPDAQRLRPAQSEVRVLVAGTDRLRALNGWSAEISMEAGLAHTIRWWKARLESNRVRPSASYII
jgi:NAD dependent epimerase/dehydratase